MHPTTEPTSPTLLGFLWANRRSFAPGLLIACGRICSIAPLPLIFKRIIDREMPEKDLAGIGLLALLTLGLLAAHQFLSVRGAARIGRAVTQMILHLRARLFDKIQYLSFAYLDRQKTGRLLAKYAFDTQKIDAISMPLVNWFLPDTLYSVITLSILIAINWRLAAVVLLMLPVVAFMRWRYFARFSRKNVASRVAQESLTGTATELLGALRLVRSYGGEQRVRDELQHHNEEVARARLELIRLSSSFSAFSWGSVQALTLVVVAGGAAMSVWGHVTAGTVLAFLAGLPSLVSPIQVLANISEPYFLGRESYRSVKELLDEGETERWHGTRVLAEPIRGRIEFDRVAFRYTGADRDALRDFTLTIEPGQRVALVGASGAGKSTLASLLLGLYHASGGEIRIDGVPQEQLDMRWLRRRVAMVMQETLLLSGTVEENIRFARADATDAQVREAARLANANEFIEQLPDGYRTELGERGATLSGGQRQRIAIARALLRDPAILVLDEPTSALDYESERLIQQALDALSTGRTVVTIAHRLSTIRNADRVVVLDDGHLIEDGTFAELTDRKGVFSRMLAAQHGRHDVETTVRAAG